ncbi:MAG: DUF692 family protein [Betaproteobacteria bacterium]|nr:DUF692 family protein [Betaproteobacteria bacterium]
MFQTQATPEPWQSPPYRFAATAAAPLGVGVLFTPAMRGFVRQHREAFDFVGIVPEAFWPDTDPMGIERTTAIHAALRVLDDVAADKPLVAHGTGLMIGGQGALDRGHLARIAEWQARYGFRWYSEHLVRAAEVADGTRRAAAPLPYDRHALKRVVERVREVQALLPIPFLLENNVYAAGVPQQEMSEPMFLNRLCAATGCGLVLDVQNLCANAIDCGIDALTFLDRVDLARVVEIHVTAGARAVPAGDFFAATLCPPSELEVLEAVLWRAPKLRAVTIEIDDHATDGNGDDDVLRAVEAARRVWKLYH